MAFDRKTPARDDHADSAARPSGCARALSWLVCAAMAAIVARHFACAPHDPIDDGYIYVRYAQNLLAGRGWVFNAGEPHNTATSPLFVLLLWAEGACFGPARLPECAWITSLILVVPIGVSSYRLLLPAGALAAAATALSVVLQPHLFRTLGLPTTLELALLLLALRAWQQRRWNRMWIPLALLPLLRHESTVLMALCAVALLREGKSARFVAARAGLALLPLAAWLAFAQIAFHRLTPVSLDAKLWQARSGMWGEGLVYLGDFANYVLFHVLPWAQLLKLDVNYRLQSTAAALRDHPWLLVLALVSIALVARGIADCWRGRTPRGTPLLLAWLAVHTALYGLVLNVPGYLWYFGLCFVAVPWLLYAGAASPMRGAWLGKVAVCVLLAAYVVRYAREPLAADPRTASCSALAGWIRAHAPQDAAIVHDEPGRIACLTDRRTIDRLGLTSPEYLARLDAGQKDFCWIDCLRQPAPVFYVSMRGELPSAFAAPAFASMLVYHAEDELATRLYLLDPKRFALPATDEISVFDLGYRLSGTPAPAQTLIALDGDRALAAAMLLAPARDEGAGDRVTIDLSRAPRKCSALAFESACLVADAAADTSIEIRLALRRADGGCDTRVAEQQLGPGRRERVVFEWPRDDPVAELVLSARGPLPGVWAVCNPVLR